MSKWVQARDRVEGGARPEAEKAAKDAPRQWIYRNLTPWRIHACFGDDGELVSREKLHPQATKGNGQADDEPSNVLSIPALGEVTLPKEDAQRLNTINMRRLGQIEVRPAPSEFWTNLPRAIVIFGWLLVGLVFGAWALFFGGASGLPWAWVVAALVAVPVGALVVAIVREVRLYRRFDRYRRVREHPGPAVLTGIARRAPEGDATEAAATSRASFEGVSRGNRIGGFVDAMPRHVAEVIVLSLAVVVSVAGLGAAIHLTTQLNDLLSIDYAKIFQLDNPFDLSEPARSSPAFWQLLVGHIAQWVLVSAAALVPAAMYFQFDRQRLASVQRRWIREVFRLDPTVRTVRDIEAKYDSQIESSFGDLGPDSGLRIRSGRRSPVVVATALLVVGWFLIISSTQVPELVPDATGQLVWSSSPPHVFPVASFFRPDLTLVGYAFLGSYVFTLYHVIRGYQRRDLQPKTYNTVVVRILSAYALALVVSVVYQGPVAEVMLFFVGFTPQTTLVWLKEKLGDDRGVFRMLPLHEPAPLTNLEGIDLYDRTRLDEEGVNNVEGLAHADIVELMSSTRISAAQLVDWTDQAILYLHVGGDAAARYERATRTRKFGRAPSTARAIDGHTTTDPPTNKPSGAPPNSGDGASPEPPTNEGLRGLNVMRNVCHLRAFGIRTASDLLRTYEEALRRGRERADLLHSLSCTNKAAGTDQTSVTAKEVADYELIEVAALRKALELPDAPTGRPVPVIQAIIDTLPGEEWFAQIRNWRQSEFGVADAWYS